MVHSIEHRKGSHRRTMCVLYEGRDSDKQVVILLPPATNYLLLAVNLALLIKVLSYSYKTDAAYEKSWPAFPVISMYLSQ
jgi:hypothetical protein